MCYSASMSHPSLRWISTTTSYVIVIRVGRSIFALFLTTLFRPISDSICTLKLFCAQPMFMLNNLQYLNLYDTLMNWESITAILEVGVITVKNCEASCISKNLA